MTDRDDYPIPDYKHIIYLITSKLSIKCNVTYLLAVMISGMLDVHYMLKKSILVKYQH